jgi:hypothetical protein
MKRSITAGLIMLAGLLMMVYGLENYAGSDNSFANWFFSDGGLVLVGVGVYRGILSRPIA